MSEYVATRYSVGGLYTHGGDIEWDYDEQPAGLIRIWDGDTDSEWREFAAEDGPLWRPIGDDGEPLPDGLGLTWFELLKQFGPVSDVEPVYEPLAAGVTRRPLSAADRADIALDAEHVRREDGAGEI